MSNCIVRTETIAMISGSSARNEPNTQASTSRAPSAPISSSVRTLELPLVALPAESAKTPVLCTVAPRTAALAAALSWLSAGPGTSWPLRGG